MVTYHVRSALTQFSVLQIKSPGEIARTQVQRTAAATAIKCNKFSYIGTNLKLKTTMKKQIPRQGTKSAAVLQHETPRKSNLCVEDRSFKSLQRMPKTGNRGVKVVGKGSSNNTFAGGLSQQMRAVSSPSLTEPYSESRKLPVESTTPADGSATVATITSSGSGGGGVGLGVLLKFKRTFNNFNNKNQFHTPALPTSAASNGNLPKSKSSPTTPSVAITTAGTVTTNDCAGTDGGDGSYGRYRFGPLIWRTSRERRKTKFNRRDKCNSGDSGIQIELDHDEQYSRVLAVGAQGDGVRQGETIASSNTSIGSESKTRTIRRTNSAKASSILGSVTLKSKNHMQLDFGGTDNIEREAPESLPTRSLSQPNGLEAYGIGYPDMADSDSDSIASHEEATSYYSTIYAEVLYNFTAGGPQELGLERGMLIEILRKEVGPWWFGRIKKEETNRVDEILDPELGWFPKEFVRIIQCPETDRFFNAHQAASDAEQASTTAEEAGDSVPVSVADFPKDADVTMATDQSNITTIIIEAPPLSSNEVFTGNVLDNETVLRRGAIRELLDTEVNYVKLLAAICDGYLPAMSKRIDIFSPNSIRLIFSNITAIYKFQAKFLDSLRKGIEQNQIAKVFLKMHKGFLCYSNYCNAYSRALIELESYDRVKDARTILENCRESENLAELPLSAHLLAPVQRICRYPLHLNEIIKSALASAPVTGIDKLKGSSSSDYEQLDVNEIDIPDTYDTVNLALEAMRGITEAVNEGKRHSETIFIYKGRIFLDRCHVVNVRDIKMFGHTIKNSLRIYCESRDKWYDFSFRSANRKHRFLNTLALERQFGGKALYVSEMTGFEYNYEERPGDFSDQSDYELPDFEHALCATSASGESSVPKSPTKSAFRFWNTLPKKSQSRDGIASVDNSQMLFGL